jgi:hypothetical protein
MLPISPVLPAKRPTFPEEYKWGRILISWYLTSLCVHLFQLCLSPYAQHGRNDDQPGVAAGHPRLASRWQYT